MARAGRRGGGGGGYVNNYVIRNNARLALWPSWLQEGSVISAGKVLVAHVQTSVILLGKNGERFPFNHNFFRNGVNETKILLPTQQYYSLGFFFSR